jgi:hypothetical protein
MRVHHRQLFGGPFILVTNNEILGSPVTPQIFLVARNDEINILEYVT